VKRTPLKRGSKRLQQKAPMKATNPKRRRRLQREQFGSKAHWIRTLPCCLCHRPSTLEQPSTSSHVRGRGAGGKADQQVPMCPACHLKYEAAKARYDGAHRLPELAARLEALWLQMEEARITAPR
jgi:hypothetical protein